MLTLDQTARNPGPDAPIDMLLTCHDKIRRFCDQLDRLVPYLQENGVDDMLRTTIDNVVRYFDLAGPAHHQDEEEELFPILLARVPSCAPKLEQLSAEHGYLHSCWNAIRDDLTALRNGEIETISKVEISEFVRLYREHAAIEEAWLLPAASKTMTPEEQRHAGERMVARRRIA